MQPWILRSRRKSTPCNSILVPTGIMPISVAVPPERSAEKLCSAVVLRPMHSNE